MELQDFRRELDGIDSQLLQLFYRRMEITAQIGEYKKENNLPVCDPAREREVLLRIADESPEGLGDYAVTLYSLIFELSRARQNRLRDEKTALAAQIMNAIANTPSIFPESATVACQGVARLQQAVPAP